MKKVINILVSIVFLICSIGINISKHYSQGKLYSTAVFQEAESCCENMGQKEKTSFLKSCKHYQENDCSCKTETETFKISEFFVNKKFSIAEINTSNLLFVSLFNISEIRTFSSTYNTNIHSPPSPLKIDTQSQFWVFLI